MDNENIIQKRDKGNWGGIILIVIGLFLFLQNLHLEIPSWVFSWKMLMVVLGLLIGLKHNFRGGAWFIMVLIGSIFLAEDILPWSFNLPRYGWPLVLVIIGVYMLVRRPYTRTGSAWNKRTGDAWKAGKLSAGSYQETTQGSTGDDYLDATAIFGGVNRVVLSKNFQGGDVTSIFGGSEINFSQADFTGTVVIEATAIFGGIELVVPSNWEVKMEMNTIFGGVDDKRAVELMSANPDKILVIRGTCIFGGVDIKNY